MRNTRGVEFLKYKHKRKRTIKRAIFFIIAALFVVWSIGAFSSLLAQIQPNETVENKPSIIRKVARLVLSGDRTLSGFKEDRINVLFLGIGGQGHDGPQLSDTIILTSIKPSTSEIAMLSIPRDLAIPIPGYGVKKINHTNAYGEEEKPGKGGDFAANTIAQTLNIPIHYWIRVDFKAFEEIVDKLGGLTVNVEQTFIDNQYPTENHGVKTVIFEAGLQSMDGKHALEYARSRHGSHGEGSDFARARRQQKIIAALKDKVASPAILLNPKTLKGIASSLIKHVDTNVNLWQILEFAKQTKSNKNQNIVHHVLTPDPERGLLKEVSNRYGYFLVPRAGDFSDITNFIENMFEIEPPPPPPRVSVDVSSLTSAKLVILNGTWEPGIAGALRKLFEEEGIDVDRIGNSPTRGYGRTLIYQLNKNEKTQNTLTRIAPLLGVEVIEGPPDFEVDESVDIIIIVGKDRASYENNETEN